MRILVVEDNVRLREFIRGALRAHGFAVDTFGLAADAEAAMLSTRYDAMVLDLCLPDRDGLSLSIPARTRSLAIPLLMLTAKDSIRAIIDGLNSGADDYLCKPFEIEELIARIKALLRRPRQALSALLCVGNVELDTVARYALIGGSEAKLSRRELAALELVMRRSGRAVSKAELEESLYGFGDEVASNAVEVLMHRLRKKLAASAADISIHTLRGIGYLLSRQPS